MKEGNCEGGGGGDGFNEMTFSPAVVLCAEFSVLYGADK